MNSPIEAQSLSNLNYLLANPPQYPRNPTHEIHKPLVLYIVRVPGSKDVFLTPLKPATKTSISLEAIQTSLYYLHVNSPGDEGVLHSVNDASAITKENENLPLSVHRKPLPTAPYANYPISQRPTAPPKSYPHYQPGPDGRSDATQLERFVTRGSHVRFDGANNALKNSVRRKPLGPRKFESLGFDGNADLTSHDTVVGEDSQSQYGQDLHFAAQTDSALATASTSDTVYLRSVPSSQCDPVQTSTDLAGHRLSSPGHSCPDLANDSIHHGTTITLIRRDPTSGAQWNIGTVQLEGRATAPSLESISIHLLTPGYRRFDGQQEVPTFVDSGNPDSVRQAMAHVREKQTIAGSIIESGFARIVEYRKKVLSGISSRSPNRDDSSGHVALRIHEKTVRSVFSFLSPWQGMCVFTNGIDGRSVRCRHTIKSRNPSSDVDDEKQTATVAEIRFNLAWSALDTATKDRHQKGLVDVGPDTLPISELLKDRHGGKEAWRRGVRHFKNLSRDLKDRRFADQPRPDALSSRNTSAWNSEEDVLTEHEANRLSLKLGREKAGGGYRGNSAKLGKLIIENEGLKMGDLVVAACMGVWWQHYDRCEPQ